MMMKKFWDNWQKKLHPHEDNPMSMWKKVWDNWKKMLNPPETPMSMMKKFWSNPFTKRFMSNMMSNMMGNNAISPGSIMMSGINRTIGTIANNTNKGIDHMIKTGKMPSPINVPAWIVLGNQQQKYKDQLKGHNRSSMLHPANRTEE